MAKSDDRANGVAFLSGDSATARLIAKFDWNSTSVGPLNGWPQCLKNATSTVLRSSVPMALLWGEDGVTIYNDAYAALLGKRHPQTLGSKARETSPVPQLSEQAIKTGLAGGTLAFRDFEVRTERSGRPGRGWVNIDCSPVLDETGRPAGVLSIVVDTTQRMRAERRAALEIKRLQRMFEQAPGFICLLSGPEHVFEFVNEAHKRLFGDRDAVGKPIREAFADIADQGFPDIIDRVWSMGERFIARAGRALLPRPSDGTLEEHFLDFVLEPILWRRPPWRRSKLRSAPR